MHVHDIRPGRSCDEEIVQGVKKVIRIIAAQTGPWRQSEGVRSRYRGAVRPCPGGRGRPIAAIGAPAQDYHTFQACNIQGCGQGEFLIPPSEAIASERDSRLATCNDTGRRNQWGATLPYLPPNRGMHAGNVPGFSL
jgi:hypothetical protein